MDFSSASSRTPTSTPSSSPGLFSPTTNPLRIPLPPLSDGTPQASPYLHPLQMHKVRETHKAQVEQDYVTGRKLINQYEVIEEIGRGVHGKVKLARSLETGENVAIKIIQRFSKKRRLGRVTVSPEDKTKREIAILKKVRHPNVVGLLEVIDDPELKKIYMVLEHVELGEITWRKKGAPQICLYERRRVEMEQRGLAEDITGNDEKYFRMMERRRQLKESKRAGLSQQQQVHGPADYWSLEHGDDNDDASDMLFLSHQRTHGSTHALSARQSTSVSDRGGGSFPPSRTPSRAPSRASSRSHTPFPEYDIAPLDSDNEDETPLASSHAQISRLDGTYYGSYPDEPPNRVRSPSINDSIISRMSSLDDIPHDAFEEDYSYVPWFSLDQARSSFRDTVLGLEYLHYEGIVHRDIKPANLLWTKDHRVKISDFGVSYFGRPIREGETEENISEADATDFDDDLELAKTVGTPAFFAPELCYTDLDMEQPKITEQIDVWSLGVTLYCLIFARIPFLADDEYKLFRSIAKDDVYIPKRRLRAVDPLSPNSTSQTSLNKRVGPIPAPYREDGELAYEDVDDELYDLLRRMLLKDPAERMKLREVKRHPWVIRGIDNVIGWLDDTDPSRRTAGRRIQVDDRELERAVVPITFLERARSAVKKTINKVIGVTRSETRGESSRKRAISSATSSGADILHTPLTPGLREARRSSLRGDETLFGASRDQHEHREPYEHPLSQSLTASPDLSIGSGDPFDRMNALYPAKAAVAPKVSGISAAVDARPGPPDRSISAAASIETVIQRSHSHSKSATNVPLSSTFYDEGPSSLPYTDSSGGNFEAYMFQYGRGREALAEIEEGTASRARSVDRSLFQSENKHADPSVAVSPAVVPGHVEHMTELSYRPSRSADTSPTNAAHEKPLPSPLFFQAAMVHAHQSASTPNVPYAASNPDDRPSTASKTPEEKPSPQGFRASTPEIYPLVQESLGRRRADKGEEDPERKQKKYDSEVFQEIQTTPDTPLADHGVFPRKEEDAKRAQSYGSVYSTGQASATSPSDVTSPASSDNLGSRDKIFQSVPSLPALISGASSVSADTEGEFLQQPGVTYGTEPGFTAESTPETLTPPSISKQSTRESEVVPGTMEANDDILLGPDVDEEGYNGDGDTPRACLAGEDSDSDSDGEGLTMTRRKKPQATVPCATSAMPRRGTNASAGSTETAKQTMIDS